jgi:hypothetical protein
MDERMEQRRFEKSSCLMDAALKKTHAQPRGSVDIEHPAICARFL